MHPVAPRTTESKDGPMDDPSPIVACIFCGTAKVSNDDKCTVCFGDEDEIDLHGDGMTNTRICILGDSQVSNALRSYGFASLLSDHFNGKADIILRKFPGYTTEWIRMLTGSCFRNLQDNKPDYVIVMVGRDDCMRSDRDKRKPVHIDEFAKYLNSILNKITNEVDVQDERFIVLSPVPMHAMNFDSYDQNNFLGLTMDEDTLKAFGKKTREVAKKIGAQFVDMTALLSKGLDRYVRPDGYRMSAEGHKILAEKILSYIEIAEPPYPPADMIGDNYEEELDKISKSSCLVPPVNIQAHTSINTIDQYTAFFRKTYRGKV